MRQLFNIIWRNKPLVAIVISALVVCAMHLIPDARLDKGWDDRLRFAGGLLQLLGIYVVVAGINKKRAMFNLGSLWDEQVKFVQAIRQYLHLGAAPNNIASGGGSLGSLQGGGSLSTYGRVLGPGASDQDRIEALEKAHASVVAHIASVEGRLQNETIARAAAIHAERGERDTQDRKLEETIRKAVVGDINFDLAGVIWIFVGIVLATYSQELSKLF